MSDKGSVFSKGGGGTSFEHHVQTAFLVNLIIGGNAPSIPANEIIEVAFQSSSRGYATDDLLVIAKSASGEHKLLSQIKHTLTFSEQNKMFQDVIVAFWKDYNNTSIFDTEKDRLLIIKNGLNKEERNNVKTLLAWAKTHTSEVNFLNNVNRIAVKKEKLEVFRTVLKRANNDIALSDLEVWKFLRCLDVIEYDFLQTSSTDEVHFLNLIKIVKSSSTTANEGEIWNALVVWVSKLNMNGGNVTTNSVRKEDVYKYFDTHKTVPAFRSVNKLKSDSAAIFKPIKSTIGRDYKINRSEINLLIAESINNVPFTIVTGKPGVGKSAAVKDVLGGIFPSATVLGFRADQLNVPHLANTLTGQGIKDSISDIFSCISIIPDKIILIESLEKLLEGDPENAFKQLYQLLREFPDLRFVGTARKYAIDLIIQKYGINRDSVTIIEVPTLTNNDLSLISNEFPQLKGLLKNEKINKLLCCLKYLEFTIDSIAKKADDYSTITAVEFKERLWNALVKDVTTRVRGMPAKREEAFLHIAVKRAKDMKLFVKPEGVDMEAVDLLEADGMVFQERQTGTYSPTHDILEDWALVKHIVSITEIYSNTKELFDNLGKEPAIRRAFRLWVEDFLVFDSSKINNFIKASLKDDTIERYWIDELLVTILKSDNSQKFFQTFETELLEENAMFLNRCLHLLRTACKESVNFNDSTLLVPVGPGWSEAVFFIKTHISKLNNLRISIVELLDDLNYGLGFRAISKAEKENIKHIVLYFIKQIETGEEFWQQWHIERRVKDLIYYLYDLSDIAQTEITELIERASKAKNDETQWKIRDFYRNVIRNCLSGVLNYRLPKELPEIIIKTAWEEWKIDMGEKLDRASRFDIPGFVIHDVLENDECWGIYDKSSFFPPSVYKTPIYNILLCHPTLGIKFISEFINYSVDFYVKAKCRYKHTIKEIEIELNDGVRIKQWGAFELWGIYRGQSVTHFALECLLVSLEKYLIETAERKTERSRASLNAMFDFLLRNSNNVAVSGVLTSVSIAYPEEVGEAMLPLLSVKEFYEWDFTRSQKEQSSHAFLDRKIPFAQKEVAKWNALPHRGQYMRGLADFVIDYQFNIRTLNAQIHQIFGKLRESVSDEDIFWEKRLTEMDIRNWEVKDYNEQRGGFEIQPKYSEKVSDLLESGKAELDAQSIALGYSGNILKVYENEVSIDFDTWQVYFDHYSQTENLVLLFERPVTVSVVGLRDFMSVMTTSQKTWCIETICQTIIAIIRDESTKNFSVEKTYNYLERLIALKAFHLLIDAVESKDERNQIIGLIIYTLTLQFPEHEEREITNYFRNTFQKSYPHEGKKVWSALIKYAEFRKANPYYYDWPNQDELLAVKQKEAEFIEAIYNNDNIIIAVGEIDFEKYQAFILVTVFAITPFDSTEPIYREFLVHLIPVITKDLDRDQDFSHSLHNNGRQILSGAELEIELYLAELLLKGDNALTKEILRLLLNLKATALRRFQSSDDGTREFVGKVLEFLVLKFYDAGSVVEKDIRYTGWENNFWMLWREFFRIVKEESKIEFIHMLFLNIQYLFYDSRKNVNEQHWLALKDQKEFFYEMVLCFNDRSITKYLIDLFSTIGEKPFLPDGLKWLTDILRRSQAEQLSLSSQSAERLIKRIFYNHIPAIKQDKEQINNFIWILERMIDLGSSEAYLFRENVIIYKTPE